MFVCSANAKERLTRFGLICVTWQWRNPGLRVVSGFKRIPLNAPWVRYFCMGVFYVPKALNRFYSTVGFILHFLAYLILVVVRGVAIYWVDNGTGVYIFKNFEDLGENEKLDMKKQVLSDFLPTKEFIFLSSANKTL